MAGTGVNLIRKLRALLGTGATVDTDPNGMPRVFPRTEEGVAAVLATASSEGWRVRVEGSAHWIPADAPADLAISTRSLAGVVNLDPPDLVATVQAGILWDELRQKLADHGVWVAQDPPGAHRTLGSIVATASSGPLRTGFGNLREHVLGLTLVTGEGRIIRPGGRVVKNVAGFDLVKLATGSFGAFGIITSLNLRLRAVPQADLTLAVRGNRDALTREALALMEQGATPAAMELLGEELSLGDGWILAIRLIGSWAAVDADRQSIAAVLTLPTSELKGDPARQFWRLWLERQAQSPITLRLGTLPSAMDEALDLLAHHLEGGTVAASIPAGSIRWSGTAPADRIRVLRHAAAQREMPVTVERAPWDLRHTLGHFGAYREGVGRITKALRRTFDPAGVLVVPLDDDR
ncbi:putative FAD-linked oxidoreductase [bacterium HR33]|nr:putative FAD-linked oxidoreductase [bacterium HR33]